MSGERHRRRLRALLRLAGVRAAGDMEAVETAFIHESYAKERGGDSNERMEFFGDSILGFITAQWLYERYAGEPEGKLTVRKAAIVNDAQLAVTARRLGFPELISLGSGMTAAGGADNTSILADAFEAFVAAIFIRYGLERSRRFLVAEHIERIDHETVSVLDPKTRLQHYAQAHLAATPIYREKSLGTAQKPSFSSKVSVNGKTLGTGSGPSKKAAQQAAAQAALSKLQVSP